MQVLFQCRRLVLTLAFVLILGSLVQGYPAKKSMYQLVRCNPYDDPADCADEGSTFESPSESESFLSETLVKNYQDMNDAFPVTEDFSGSDSGSGSGSGFGSDSEEAISPDIEDELMVDRKYFYNFKNFQRDLPPVDYALDPVEGEEKISI